MGPQHGFGLAKRIQQISQEALSLNQGTLYPALLRLEQRGWIGSPWGVSEANRRAKFYELTRAGREVLAEAVKRYRLLEQTQLNKKRDQKPSRA